MLWLSLASIRLKYFVTSHNDAIICKIRWIHFTLAYFIFGTRRSAGGFVIFRKRIARSIPSPERMNRPFASWNSFTPAGRKMQRLYKKKKEAKKEEHKRQPRRIRESVAIPTALQLGGISRNASRVEIACVEWKARKNNFAVLPTRRVPLMAFVFVVAIYLCLLSKLSDLYCHIFIKLYRLLYSFISYKDNWNISCRNDVNFCSWNINRTQNLDVLLLFIIPLLEYKNTRYNRNKVG